jgi:DNA (cytosine-5)-methyltransferase 1
MPKFRAISLFTGAGGLDLGLETAGFIISSCVEIDPIARLTLERNRPEWLLVEPSDILALQPKELLKQSQIESKELDLLVGGPPCQPFSVSSHWTNGGPLGLSDPRAETIRSYLKIVRYALPRVILLENVGGITRSFRGNSSAIDYIQQELENINKSAGTSYRMHQLNINAADYGVPQFRERVFLLASRDGCDFKLPPASHGLLNGLQPFTSVWDAIGDLDTSNWPDTLRPTGKWADLLPSIPEGCNYLWHTEKGNGLNLFGWRTKYWSFLLKLAKNKPSWTIQASPGPASGPFHWRNRMLSIEELLRLQTFPADYIIKGPYRMAVKQIGNAVPSAIGELLGNEICRQFLGQISPLKALTLIPKHRNDCPVASLTEAVPEKYHHLIGEHPKHPGTGKGPGKIHIQFKEPTHT